MTGILRRVLVQILKNQWATLGALISIAHSLSELTKSSRGDELWDEVRSKGACYVPTNDLIKELEGGGKHD